MFRSSRRDVVYPQREHAVLAGELALVWGNDRFPRPPLPFESFVRGVALHDRGYDEHDVDEIGGVPRERWLEIQRAGSGELDDDPVVDLVVSMHLRRLVGHGPLYEEMSEALPGLCRRAGVDRRAAEAADAITGLCDGISFDVCMEEQAAGDVEITDASVRYSTDGHGGVHVTPWPFGPPSVDLLLVGFRAAGYPERLERVVEPVRISG